MSVRYENECVGCPSWMGCLGELCPNRHVAYYDCDECKGDAEFEIDGKHYCADCMEKFLNNEWSNFTVYQKVQFMQEDYEIETLDY